MVNGGKYTSLMDPFWKMNHLMQALIFIVPQWWLSEESFRSSFAKKNEKHSLGGGSIVFFMFTPCEVIQFDEHIFQMGRNHQLLKLVKHALLPSDPSSRPLRLGLELIGYRGVGKGVRAVSSF